MGWFLFFNCAQLRFLHCELRQVSSQARFWGLFGVSILSAFCSWDSKESRLWATGAGLKDAYFILLFIVSEMTRSTWDCPKLSGRIYRKATVKMPHKPYWARL
jgi:hypothetical protein